MPDITSVEYFFDTDPGYGNGTAVSFTANSIISATFTTDLNGLALGTHTLVIRVKDGNNRWSIAYAQEVEKTEDNIWSGTISVEWNNSGNWSGEVPINTSFVVIPDVSEQSGNFPTVNNNANAFNIMVEPNATITINSGKSLTIEHELKMRSNSVLINNGTLTIKGTNQNK